MTPFQGKLRSRHLEIVLAIVEYGSLSKAALQMHMTQSGLSRAITEIEEVVGGRLFERTGKGMVCTPLGEAMCRHANILLGDLAAAETDLAAVSSGDLGSLTVGCFSMFSGWPLAESVRQFQAEYPRVALTIQVGTHERLMEDLDAFKLDVLISRSIPSLNPDIYRFTPLLEDSIVLTCAIRHPLSGKSLIELTDCMGFTWITPPPKSRVRAELENRLRQKGSTLPSMVGALSLEFTMEMLRSTDYLCLLPSSVAAVLRKRQVLYVLPVPLDLQAAPLAAIWRRERSSTRQVRAFAAVLAHIIRAETDHAKGE